MKTVVLVGGGTSGHVEPALAVGRWLESKSSEINLKFIGTKSGVEVELLVNTGITFHPILKVPFPRKFNFSTIVWPFKFFFAYLQALICIKGSGLVIGFGGYVSAPAYLAAATLRTPIIIHEANALPGLANRFGSIFTKNIFVAFDKAKKINSRWRSAILSGVPIKEAIDNFSSKDLVNMRDDFLKELDLDSSKKTLLIFGGSVGAEQINKSVLEAKQILFSLNWNIIHAVGQKNEPPLSEKNYRAVSYISDMAGAYAAADFVISRSGAVTCAELAATGIPALLVPLAVGNGEQDANAAELIAMGQATKIKNREFTGEWLKANIGNILKSAPTRKDGGASNAATIIGSRALEILNR